MPGVIRFAYARHALVAALKHLDAQSGDIVEVPEFICRDVLASLQKVGVQPRFYPVDRKLRPLGSSVNTSSQFVLMVNYFGFPQNVAEFRSRWPNAKIIEDNAHGFLSRDQSGIDLGTRTDAGITSCRKTILLPDGAFLHTATESELDHSDVLERRPVAFGFFVRSSASRCERATGIPINSALRETLRLIRRVRTGSPLPRSDSRAESTLPKDVHMSSAAFKILNRVDRVEEVERRRRLFYQCADFASELNVEAIFWDIPNGCAPYGFPFIADNSSPLLKRLARRLHCEIIRWPDLPSKIVVPADHFYNQVRVINFL